MGCQCVVGGRAGHGVVRRNATFSTAPRGPVHTAAPSVGQQQRKWMCLNLAEFLISLISHKDIPKHLNLTVQIVQWMCFSFNDSESSRFKDDFYCISPGILV